VVRVRQVSFALLAAAALAALPGCAMQVQRSPATLLPAAEDVRAQRLHTAATIHFRLSTGYERTVPQGTEFVRAGRVEQGEVLRPTSYVLTVEGANVHEAFLVVTQARLVGFYLPAERAFAPLVETVEAKFVEGGM
jgi:hypothetical protein